MGGGGGAGSGGGARRAPAVDERALRAWFETYQDPVEEGCPPQMTAEGVMQFCADIGIDAMDPVVLVVSFHMKAENMCVYTREEFERGMKARQQSAESS